MTANATVKSTTGATLGTISVTCFDTIGLVVKLNALDNPGGSGVASLTYASTGAQVIASTTVSAASASPSFTAMGLSTLTFFATDVAGNRGTTQSQSIGVIVGTGDDGVSFGCAAPTPTFAMPAHGTLVVSGTASSNGFTFPFGKTITF